MKKPRSRSLGGLLALTGLLVLALALYLPEGQGQHLAAFILLWIIPAALWALALAGSSEESSRWPIALAAGVGLATFVPVLLALIASYVPGPLSSLQLAIISLMSLLAPFALWLMRVRPGRRDAPVGASPPDTPTAWSRQQWMALLVILGLAAGLRLINLEYKEFQGDEGVIMERAAQALTGDEMALLRHQKGPVEILLPLIPWGLTGSIDETWARAVFTWAGWLAVGAIALLGRRLYDARTGLLAALFFTLGGFSIAFSRIVQYQSFVMFWTLLSLLFAYRYYRRGAYPELMLSVAFLAGGLLAHYDAILAAPAVGWLFILRWRKYPARWQTHLLSAALFGAALLALFYGPYLAGPSAGGTGSYLLQDRIGGSLFTWSGPQVWRMATFYNSTYYVVLLILLAVAGAFSRKLSVEHAVALLLLLSPLLFYTFVVADPRTHVYTLFPGLSLVAAAGVFSIWKRLHQLKPRRASLARYAAITLLGLLLGASLLYVILLFVDVTPERQRTWRENRPPFFPTTWTEPPQYGLFGFPHQAGWRLAPDLVSALPYGSNEESEITNWYMAQAPRTHCSDFQTFLVAANAQDALPYDEQRVQALPLQTTVTVHGAPSLRIYGEDAPTTVAPVVEATGHTLWRTPQQVAAPARTGDVAVNVVLGDKIRLLGYTLQQETVEPGGTLDIILYWQALQPITRNYQVFVHLYDGEMWAQHDGAPDCDVQPTSGWEPGQIVRDAHRLELETDTPPAEIPLLVGMYDLITLDRLVVENTGLDTIPLTDITVSSAVP